MKLPDNFLVWRLTHIEGEKKPRKVPYYANGAPRNGTQGDDRDRAQLVSRERAEEACERGQFSGIGFAVLPDCGVVALDFDDVVVDGVVDPRVLRVVAGTYAEFSPSGTGVRAFFKGSMASRKDLKGDPKVEVFGTNGFVTITDKILPEHAMLDWDRIVPVTPACAEFLADRFGSMEQAGGVIDLFATLKPKLGLDVERVREVLAKLPKDLEYDEWVKVGMAVHHELDEAGWEVWHEWSKTSPKYGSERYCHDRWKSFGKYTGGQQLTFAWVLKQAGETAVKESVDAVRGYRQMIADCGDELHLRTRVAGTIANDQRLQSIDRATLAQAMQERFAALGIKLPISELRKLLAPPRRARVDTLPEWAQDYCYVTADDKFLRVGTEAQMTKQGFDAKFNREMPRDENGNVMRAASVAVLEDWGMPVVDRALYVPWIPGDYFEHAGMSCVNRYRPTSAPTAADSTGGVEGVILAHLRHVCGQREDVVDKLVKFMAHNVQRPGIKIRWAPVIKGVEGDGKTVIGKVLSATMGVANVRQISPKVIGTDFSGWAEGACVGILEEIKLTGHNRHDVMNALKPYLTNDDVEIHRKGRDTYNAHNTQNYMAFTNHSDALPINDNDRRWMVIFTPWVNFSEFEKVVGNTDEYFEKLHETIHSSAPQLRRWLLDIDLSDFKPNGRAPHTDEKDEMIALSVSEEEDTIRGIIEAGGAGVSSAALSTSNLSSLLRAAGLQLRTRELSNLLTKVGMTKLSVRVWWQGAAHRVWIGPNVRKDADSIRTLLDQTLCQDLF